MNDAVGYPGQTPAGPPARTTRWPTVLGTVGIVLGVVMFVDKTDDLALIPLLWAGPGVDHLLGEETAGLLRQSLPATALAVTSVTGMVLALLLLVASIRLRQRRRSGARLCKVWAWLALGWLALSLVWMGGWLGRYSQQLPASALPGGDAAATWLLVIVTAILLIHPVSLLIWLSRQPVRDEVAGWPR